MAQQQVEAMWFYVGGAGISVYRLDLSTGDLAHRNTVSDVKNPSFQAVHPSNRFLYSVAEVNDGGAIHAFEIDPATGALGSLNHQSSMGAGPCHVSVDATGRVVLAANYSSGGVAALPINDDGSLGEANSVYQHEGSSVHPGRQQGPHAHSITIDPGNRFAVSADLGIDKVLVYRLDAEKQTITPNDPPWVDVQAGAGPRHFAFHPNRKHAYLINELDNTAVAYAYDEDRGVLETVQVISTLPSDFTDTSYCADIHVSPDGRFVYGSNRGHDSIVIFEVDPDTGRLSVVDYESTRGEFPRNFALDPTGRYLFAANQNTDNIVTYRIDGHTGRLTATGQQAETPQPVCINMIPVA
ncbi:MAG: lactonase family protein [Gemmatimonadota bacterium]|nr:lactonase family protein [Gemmatimonadota bacterium]